MANDEEWTYSIDEVGEDAETEDAENGEEPSDDRRRIEPESMDPENVLFVVIGVLVAVAAIVYGLGII